MPISCVLGLTACLSFGGNAIPAKDAFAALDACGLLMQLPAESYVGSGMAVIAAEKLEQLGLKLEWPHSGIQRRASFLRTCALFERAFNNRQNWDHLEKWPNR